MASIAEIEKMSEDDFVESVMGLVEGESVQPFNSEVSFEQQLEDFNNMETRQESLEVLLNDAKDF